MDLWFLHNPAFLILLPFLVIPWFDLNTNAKPFSFPGCFLLQDSFAKINKMGCLSKTFFSACLLFLIVGLAQPSKVIKNSSVKIEGLAVEFVLDISGSKGQWQ